VHHTGASRENAAGLSEFTQMISLDFEQAGLYGRGAAQPP